MGEEVTVAYESPARERAAHRKHKLKWHRNDSGGLKAKSGKGGEFCIVRQRPDRRHGIYRWGVTHGGHSVGSTDQLAQAKGLAAHHETKQTCGPVMHEGAAEAKKAWTDQSTPIDPSGEYAHIQRMMRFYVRHQGWGEYVPDSALPTGRVVNGDGIWTFYTRPIDGGKAQKREVASTALNSVYHRYGASEGSAEERRGAGGYRAQVVKNLRMMGRRDADAFVDRHYQDVERYELAGVQPNVAAAILDAADTGFDDIRGGEAAEEAPTRSEWEVVVTNPPRAHRGAILNMVPPGDAHAEGNRIFLSGFYDDAEAQHVAGAIAKRYRSQVTFGPKSTFGVNEEAGNIGNIAEERRRPGAHRQIETRHDVDRRDKPVHGHHGHREGEPCEHGCPTGECKPFTKLSRDPVAFKTCMKRAEEIGPLDTSRKMYDLIHHELESRDREVFACVCIDFRGSARDFVVLSVGQRHRVAVDIEDILQVVILSGCDGFCVAHSHPSGKAEPSQADRQLTKMIEKAAAVACPNIKMIDHIICGNDEYYSFSDRRLTKVRR